MPVEIDIERVAHLARIALTDEEMAAYSDQLVHILEHAERVQALPTEGVEPTSHPLPMVNAFRPDEVTASLDRDDALAGAPDAEEGYFRGPKILDESCRTSPISRSPRHQPDSRTRTSARMICSMPSRREQRSPKLTCMHT